MIDFTAIILTRELASIWYFRTGRWYWVRAERQIREWLKKWRAAK